MKQAFDMFFGKGGIGIMNVEILIISFIVFVASLFVSLDARIMVKQEKEFLERITYQTEEYKALVKRLEDLKEELGYSQKDETKN